MHYAIQLLRNKTGCQHCLYDRILGNPSRFRPDGSECRRSQPKWIMQWPQNTRSMMTTV